jgi:Protein of unknown function (DUF2971)
MNKLIYKYFKLNEYLFDLLISNHLYFSATGQFNDPYDCHFAIKELPNVETFEHFLKQSFKEEDKYMPHLEMYKKEPEKAIAPILDSFKKFINNYGICCFSEIKDNFLMWSHYSDSHKGVCLGFDYEMMIKKFPQFDKVDYNNEPYFFDIGEVSKSVEKIILRKATDWHYEKEIRFLMERSKTIDFNMFALKEINFGLKCPPRQMLNLMYLINKLGYSECVSYKAIISQSSYMVAFEGINFLELKEKVLKDSEHIPFKTVINLGDLKP